MPQKEVHLRDYFSVIRKYDFIICLCFLLLIGTALVVSLHLPKTYVASTLLLFDQPASGPPIQSANVVQNVLSGGVDRSEMETIGQRFLSDSMITASIEQLEESGIGGVLYFPPVGKLRRNLKSKSRSDSQFIELSLSLSEREGGERNAALLTNQLVAEMQALRSKKESAKVDQRRQLLQEKWDELFKQVREKEKQALDFVRENGGPVTWQEELSNASLRRTALRRQQETIEWGIEASQAEFNHLQTEIGGLQNYIKLTETVGHDPIWLSQKERLVGLEVQKVGLLAGGTGDNAPGMQSINAQIDDIKGKLSASIVDRSVISVSNGISPVYSNVEKRLMGLETDILRAKHSLQQIKPKIEEGEDKLKKLRIAIPEDQLELNRIKREIDFLHELSRETYTRILQAEMLLAESDRWRAKSSTGLSVGGLEIVDGAVPRKIPMSPRIKAIVAIAGIVGLALGVSVALLMEYFSTTYSSPEEAESDIDTLYLGHVSIGAETNVVTQPVSEDYQQLAANINLSHPEIKKQVLMLAGCDHDDSVSVITANLGVTLASVKDSVLVVDCNLLAPQQHEMFGASSDSAQQSEQISAPTDWQRAIQKTGIANVDLFSIRSVASTPIELLHSPRVQGLFEQLREHYELILLDTPPLLTSADGIALGTHADAVVSVLNLATTTRKSLRSTRDRMAKAKIPVLGFIET